jgi:UDPglucose 6-dehydrogenase
MARITVVGLGYVGLVTATGLAELGNLVVGLDVLADRVARLEGGEMPIYEPGLAELVARNRAAKRLEFTTDYEAAVPPADMVFLAVPTPEGPTGEADLRFLRRATESLAPLLREGAIVAIKSTVPPGTGDRVQEWLDRHRGPGSIRVVAHPEFLREGSALEDFFAPDRVVVGTTELAAAEAVARLYERFGCPVVAGDRRSAEMIKYASNAFLATKISFINEIAQICDRVGADVKLVAQGMGHDRRIGPRFLDAGIGYGGSCFPKDVKALEHVATGHGAHPQILRAVMEVNRGQRVAVVNNLRNLLGELHGRTIGLLGLAFKPNTDDLRGAPAIALSHVLIGEGCRVVAYDPIAMANAARQMPEVLLCPDAYAVAALADALVLVTDWDEFRQLDLARLRDMMGAPILVDGRNMFEPAAMRELGFVYVGIGRGAPPATAISRVQPLPEDAQLAPASITLGGLGANGQANGQTNGHAHVPERGGVLWPSLSAVA